MTATIVVFLLNEILKLKQIFRRSLFSLETFLDLGGLGFIMTAIICMQHLHRSTFTELYSQSAAVVKRRFQPTDGTHATQGPKRTSPEK